MAKEANRVKGTKEAQVILAAVQAQVPAQIASSADVWTAVGSIATAAAVVVAICLAIPQFRHNRKALQVQILESVFKDIRQLDYIWLEQDFEHAMLPEQKRAWCASFFNTVEYLCFLMNHGFVRQEGFDEFWMVAMPRWQNDFTSYVGQGLIKADDTMFTEFKKIRERFEKRNKS